jgi:FkbM family methyltransferase
VSQDPLRTELEALFSADIAEVVERERTAFDRVAGPYGDSLVLFGAGNLGRRALDGLRELGIEPIAFADNSPALRNGDINGVRVLSPGDAVRAFGDSATFVITIWRGEAVDRMHDRRRQLLDLGCSRITTFGELFWKYPETFVPHYAIDLPSKVHREADSVLAAYDLWADDESRREYVAQVRWRMLMDFDGLPAPVEHDIYFPDDLVELQPHEVFVDCGAFDGDTLQGFVGRRGSSFERAICFEPDPGSFEKLNRYVRSLPTGIRDKVETHQLAVGARREKVYFDAMGTASSSVGAGTVEVECVTLDEVLQETGPTLVKMDIEGAELDALEGARRTISRSAPMLAVSAYHRQDHVWRVPLLVRSMSDEYRFFLRPYLAEGWDLVCYAVP